MGMRNMVGEKVEQWEIVAKKLGLPAPADHETAMVLDWKACQAWMRMGDTIRNWFRVQVAQQGMISVSQQDYFKRVDPDFKMRHRLATHGLEVAMLMRCVGILEATFAEHEARLMREKYKLWDGEGTVHTPVFYTWWKAPKGWLKAQADVHEDEYEARGQRSKLIAREFSFIWT